MKFLKFTLLLILISCTATGTAEEEIEILYDPNIVSYEELIGSVLEEYRSDSIKLSVC
jgi:hypothetical protein